MQQILDDLQSDEQDELNKVSLERLASIDPDLLTKIKQTAEVSIQVRVSGNDGSRVSQEEESELLSFLMETRTQETLERGIAWEKLNLNHLKDTHDIIASLQRLVRDRASAETGYTQPEAIEMTSALAAAASAANVLTNALQRLQKEDNKINQPGGSPFPGSSRDTSSRGWLSIDKNLFTSKGVRERNESVVGILYEAGLPFVSSSDGRRFATQLELSQHLDALFKRG